MHILTLYMIYWHYILSVLLSNNALLAFSTDIPVVLIWHGIKITFYTHFDAIFFHFDGVHLLQSFSNSVLRTFLYHQILLLMKLSHSYLKELFQKYKLFSIDMTHLEIIFVKQTQILSPHKYKTK